MDYKKIYHEIIERSKNRTLSCYTEKHHIIPKCLGGSNEKENIVILTPKEHYMCHFLLYRMNKDNKKLSYAFWIMCNGFSKKKREFVISSRVYSEIRENISYSLRESKKGVKRPESVGIAVGNAHRGKEISEQQKKIISESNKNKIISQETRDKISKALTGRKHTETHCKKNSDKHRGQSPTNKINIIDEDIKYILSIPRKEALLFLKNKYGCLTTKVYYRYKKQYGVDKINKNQKDDENKKRFLDVFQETKIVTHTLKKTNLSQTLFYRWFYEDKDFKEMYYKILHQK